MVHRGAAMIELKLLLLWVFIWSINLVAVVWKICESKSVIGNVFCLFVAFLYIISKYSGVKKELAK
jgi:uncharacterized membrane protein